MPTVASGKYGNSTPMFGFERQGAPVTSFVRLSNEKIRAKNQVYNPDCTLILDPSLLISAPVFEGMKEDSVAVLNTQVSDAQSLITSPNIKRVAWLDATTIALEMLGRPITNTISAGRFCEGHWLGRQGGIGKGGSQVLWRKECGNIPTRLQ